MKDPIFEYPSYRYKIKDWSFKKKAIRKLKEKNFARTELQTFETDRQNDGSSYMYYLAELIKPELSEFCKEAKVTCSMTDAWTVRYQKGDRQTIHNHRSWGFSGIIFWSSIQKSTPQLVLYLLIKILGLTPQPLQNLQTLRKVI